MLQLLIMNDMSFLYRKANGFDFQEFSELKKKVLKEQRYSRFLIEVVMEMIDLDTTTRPKSSIVLEWIRPYEKDIVRLRRF